MSKEQEDNFTDWLVVIAVCLFILIATALWFNKRSTPIWEKWKSWKTSTPVSKIHINGDWWIPQEGGIYESASLDE